MSGYPGANRPHGGHHSMPQAQPYQYAPPPGPPQGYQQQGYQGGYGGPPPLQQYEQQGGWGGPPPSQGFHQPQYVPNQYAPPPGFPSPQPSYNAPQGPPPMHYAPQNQAPPQNFGPSQYQGGQFQVHMQPQNNAQMYSNCSGKRKALSIGINYTGTSNALRGCVNDQINVVKFLCDRYGFKREDVVTLSDKPGASQMELPTRQNIIRAMQWLVRDARPNDSLFFHYSGHGGQAKDTNGDEDDGYDETIYPLDFKTAGQIVDDDMHAIMVAPLPQGCRLTAIFDSCHSGSALDLPYIYSTQGKIKGPNLLADAGSGAMSALTAYARGDLGGVFKSLSSVGQKLAGGNKASQITKQTKSSQADVISWSGCKDSQTSADTSEAGKATGAMSYAFIAALTKYPQQSYVQLLNTIRDELRGKYDQKPQLSCSHELDTSLLAIM